MRGKKPTGECLIYIDNGGTFTDAVIVASDGTFVRGKDDTLPDSLEVSFINSIKDACKNMGSTVEETVKSAQEIGYGTTIGTNMLVSEAAGPKLGLVTTKGFENRIFQWRQRAAGVSKVEAMHMISSGHPRVIIPRNRAKGVAERIDYEGEVVLPLQEDSVRQAVKELLAEGVEGIAVGLLFSFLNNSHEVRVKEIIEEMSPGLPVAISSEVAPVAREYPRLMSTIIDLHLGKALRELLAKIESDLAKLGYTRPLLIMQAIGGVSQAKVVHAGTTLHSGPVGGLVGVEYMKKFYGFSNAVGSDVGGTSFDVVVSSEKGEEFLRLPVVGRYEIATPMREIITIGAGGGSIAWIEKTTNTLRVGPQSAGGRPGPIVYDLGGTEPTVTDADVVLNRLNPDYFLGGRKKLNRDKALRVIKEKIADPLKMDVYEAAEGIINIIDGKMAAVMKKTMVSKGIDARKYLLFAFGAAGPAHCAGYAGGLGFSRIIVPQFAATFCAFGASTSDIKHRYEMSPLASLRDLPFDSITKKFEIKKINLNHAIPGSIDRFNKMFEQLEKRAYKELAEENIPKEQAVLTHEILGRYGGQLWEIRCVSPVARIKSNDDLGAIVKAFEDKYINEYTREAMVPLGGVEIVSIALVASASLAKPHLVKHDFVGKDASGALKDNRPVYYQGKWANMNIYEWSKLQTGNLITGPAIVETVDTTVFIPVNWVATCDEYLNLGMEEIGHHNSVSSVTLKEIRRRKIKK